MKLNSKLIIAYNVKILPGIITMLFCCLICSVSFAQIKPVKPEKPDTANIAPNKTKIDSTSVNKITKDTLSMSKDSLDAPVKYDAKDSGVMILSTNEFILYGKSNVAYKDVKLLANTIKYNSQEQLVRAYGATDTSNNPLSKPTLSQGGATSISDTITFSMKNMKGLTKNTYYNEGEIYVNAEKLKKVDKNVFYAYRGRFTTCNLDTPHFAIRARKMKMISNKMAFTGPCSPEFEGVPIPIGLPFGIFPLIKGRHSGIMPPQFVTSQDYGRLRLL
jgi:LPS-assembly protein